MQRVPQLPRAGVAALALASALVLALTPIVAAFAASLTLLSTDPYTNTSSEHQTQVEPDTFAVGSTIVSAFQSGRFANGGSSNIGWATSTDAGATWTNGFLPGTTGYSTPNGPYAAVSDPSVAFDAAHKVWLIASLPLNGSENGAGVVVSRSTDGGLTWASPVVVSSIVGTDKDWIVCDNTPTSPYYGHCYVEFDNNSKSDLILMSTSTDGGQTWGAALSTANRATGLGGQPVVQPNGTVVVPINNANQTSILAFISRNGGASWSRAGTVSKVQFHPVAGGMRASPLPSAEIDAAGKVYVVWDDCRFEASCSANDLVLSTSANGTTWSAPTRVPLDPVGSGVDHFIPGLAVDRTTAGATAHLALAYYYYPASNCTGSDCQLDVGYATSTNGGSTWTSGTQLAGPMNLGWIASTSQGPMVGDYISTSIDKGLAYPVFEVATAPNGATYNEASYTVTGGLAVQAGSLTARAAGAVLPHDLAQSGAPVVIH
jgi:hypothetical protein